MDKRILKLISILSICFSLVFTSCENFLSGSNTKQQIDKMIREANAPSVGVYLLADKNAGVISPKGITECKLGKSISIVYTPSYGYKFFGWKVVDHSTGQALPDAIEFEDITKPETKITVKKNIPNMQIVPICYQLPYVTAFSPAYDDSGVYTNMPVEIEFSVPLTDENGLPMDIGFDQISLYSFGELLNDYFYKPQLSADFKTVKIVPKPMELRDYIRDKKLSNIDILVKINKNKINISKDGYTLPFFEASASDFSYSCSTSLEQKSPVEVSSYCTKEVLSLQNYSAIDSSKKIPKEAATPTEFNDKETVMAHRLKDTVYIHAKFSDTDSGIKAIEITENAIMDKTGAALISDNKKTTVYKPEELQLIQYDINSIEFILEYKLTKTDGCVSLDVCALDYCDNKSTPAAFRLIKDTSVDINEVYPFNYPLKRYSEYDDRENKDFEGTVTNQDINSIKISYTSEFNDTQDYEYIGNIGGNDFADRPFKNIKLDPSCVTLQCKYSSNNSIVTQTMSFVTESEAYKYWKTDLQVDSVAGLEFTIIATDDLGNTAEKSFKFPGKIERINNIILLYGDTRISMSTDLEWTHVVAFSNNTYKVGANIIFSNQFYYYKGYENCYIINDNNKHACLLGPGCKIAFDPEELNYECETIDKNDISVQLINPIASDYLKAAPSSSKLKVKFTFDPQVWEYWDELTITLGDSRRDIIPFTIKKGSEIVEFETDLFTNMINKQETFSISAFKTIKQEVDNTGKITDFKNNYAFVKFTPEKTIDLEHYTIPPKLETQPVFSNGVIVNWTQKLLDYNYYTNYFIPAVISSNSKITEIKCWYLENGKEINYDKLYSKYSLNNYYYLFIIPVWDFFESGSICMQVKDEYGNSSALYDISADSIKNFDVPKIIAIEKDPDNVQTYKFNFDSMTENNGDINYLTVDNDKHNWSSLYGQQATINYHYKYVTLKIADEDKNTFVKINYYISHTVDPTIGGFPVYGQPIYFYTNDSVTSDN